MNRAVVGSRMFIARTRFGWFPPIVLIPDRENPTAERSSSSSDFACVVIVVLVVENESRIDRIFCVASEYASAVLPNNCQSCCTVGILGFTASSTLFAFAIACPMRSPLPRTDSATADGTAFSFAESTEWTTDCRFSNTVLTLTVTLRECSTAPGLRDSELAPSGGTMRSTYLAPNAVLDLISASTLLGRF